MMRTYTPRDPYPEDWIARAEQVRAEANWHCELCGRHGLTPEQYPEWDRPDLRPLMLEVHHMDADPANCARDNLIALCQPCHRRVHAQMRTEAKRTGQLELSADAEVPKPDQGVPHGERAGHPGKRAEPATP